MENGRISLANVTWGNETMFHVEVTFGYRGNPLSAHLVLIFSEFPEGCKSGAVVLGW